MNPSMKPSNLCWTDLLQIGHVKLLDICGAAEKAFHVASSRHCKWEQLLKRIGVFIRTKVKGHRRDKISVDADTSLFFEEVTTSKWKE